MGVTANDASGSWDPAAYNDVSYRRASRGLLDEFGWSVAISGETVVVGALMRARRRPRTLRVEGTEAVRLVVEAGTRPAGAKDERLYQAAAEQIGLAHDPEDPERAEAIADVMAASLRAAERELRAALQDGTGRVRGRGKDTFGARFKGWLEESDRQELFEHVEAIATIFRRRQGATGGRLVTATVATCPAEVRRQRREG